MRQTDKNVLDENELSKYNLDYTDKDIGKVFNEWKLIAKVKGTRDVIAMCSCGRIEKI